MDTLIKGSEERRHSEEVRIDVSKMFTADKFKKNKDKTYPNQRSREAVRTPPGVRREAREHAPVRTRRKSAWRYIKQKVRNLFRCSAGRVDSEEGKSNLILDKKFMT